MSVNLHVIIKSSMNSCQSASVLTEITLVFIKLPVSFHFLNLKTDSPERAEQQEGEQRSVKSGTGDRETRNGSTGETDRHPEMNHLCTKNELAI